MIIVKNKNIISTIGRGNKLSISCKADGNPFDKLEIINSWKTAYKDKVSRNESEDGLRLPQFGALSAIRAHWATSTSPATIILPTGTGKTETMFATIVSELISTTLILVPSDRLREQIFDGAKQLGILPKAGLVSEDIIYPTSLLYKSSVTKEQEPMLLNAFDCSNIIVSTPRMIKNLPSELLDKLIESVDVVIFDEAHHLAAPNWSDVKDIFINQKILQFTATPFRNDGKKIGGKIIFNYGLALAQKSGYFQPIDFYPLQEFDERKSDQEIAEIAIKILENDIEKGYGHIILARVKNRKRADELFENVYSKYEKFNPVVLHSGISASKRQKYWKQVKNGEAKIVVCVNMFGEGIDLPALKIAAIHDKYKSLPITIQFIGRFARSGGDNLGNAKLITNVALDDLKESIEELYHQDSDWNELLTIHSSSAIENEIEQDNFFNEFTKGHTDKIDLSQLKMKISTRIFKAHSKNIYVDSWKEVLNSDRTTSFINEQESIYIFIEEIENQVLWSDQKEIVQHEYDFFCNIF